MVCVDADHEGQQGVVRSRRSVCRSRTWIRLALFLAAVNTTIGALLITVLGLPMRPVDYTCQPDGVHNLQHPPAGLVVSLDGGPRRKPD
jgi:hypothetical protein